MARHRSSYGSASQVPGSLYAALATSGRPLEAVSQRQMQGFFQRDFSSVRVHTDVTAVVSAREMGAEAYTVGNHIVFGAGAYAPGTDAGDRLLAHELTHVLQQREINASPALSMGRISDASDPAEVEAERMGQSAVMGRSANVTGASHLVSGPVMRAPSPLPQVMVIQRQRAGEASPVTGEKSVDPLQAESEAALAAVAAVETSWATLAAVSRPYEALTPWLADGDLVVTLTRSHTTLGLAAKRAHDNELAAAYTKAAQADKITFDYIAWHVTAYVNLLSIKSWVDGLVDSFDHDDRAFTGRKNAERITRELQTSIKGVGAHSREALSIIRTLPGEVRPGTPRVVTIVVTSPAIDPKVATLFRERTAAMQNLQVNIQQGVGVVNQFLEIAYREGLEQAEEALEEYYKVKQAVDAIFGAKGGKQEKPKKERQKEPEKRPEPQPLPHPVPAPEEGDKKPPAVMRFQVQWNSQAKDKAKKGQFSEVASALASVGVSVADAVAALVRTHDRVIPDRAMKNAKPAVAAQTKWILARPPAGTTDIRRSEYFEYDYPDARVDVESLRGHNLRH